MLADLLTSAQTEVLDVRRRHYALTAFLDELTSVTQGKPFRIHNDVLWLLLLDSRDMLVVHLASWCKAAYSPGGLFGQLQGKVGELRRRKRRGGRAAYDAQSLPFVDEAYARLFSGADATALQPTDVEALRDSFVAHVKPVLDDRHVNRAHVWEVRGTATAKMLDLAEIGAVFEFVEQLLNDLTLVVTDSTMASNALFAISTGVAADVIVDALLLGPAFVRPSHVSRADLYAAMHSAHAKRSGTGNFNDAPWDVPL